MKAKSWISHSNPTDSQANGTSQLVAGPGFEPGQTDPESVVLPLHHPAMAQTLNYHPRQATIVNTETYEMVNLRE